MQVSLPSPAAGKIASERHVSMSPQVDRQQEMVHKQRHQQALGLLKSATVMRELQLGVTAGADNYAKGYRSPPAKESL